MKAGQAVLQSLASQALQSVASLVTGVIIARGLGPEGQGRYAIFVATIGIGTVAGGLGQFQGNVLAAGGSVAGGRLVVLRSILHGGLLGAAVWIGAMLLPVRIRGVLSPLMALSFAVILALEVMAQLLRGVNLGQHHVTAFNVASLIQRVLYLIGVVILARYLGVKLQLVLVFWAVATFISVATSATWAWSRSPRQRLSAGVLLSDYFKAVRHGLRPLIVVVATLFLVRFDLWVLAPLLGVETVGQLSVANSMVEWMWYVPTILNTVMFAIVAADRSDAIVAKLCRATRSTTALILPVAVILLFVGPLFVEALYGTQYSVAGRLFVILIPGASAIALHLVVDSYFAGVGFPAVSVAAVAGALVVKAGLNALVVPTYGVYGAAAATSATYIVLLGTKVIALRISRDVPIGVILVPRANDVRDSIAALNSWVRRKALSLRP